MEHVETTDQSSERRADGSDFIEPSIYKDSIYKENFTINAFWIYS